MLHIDSKPTWCTTGLSHNKTVVQQFCCAKDAGTKRQILPWIRKTNRWLSIYLLRFGNRSHFFDPDARDFQRILGPQIFAKQFE